MNLLEIITGPPPPEMDDALEDFICDGIEEFEYEWDNNPVKNRTSAIYAADAFWLYWMVKAIQPTVIVESGTYRGFSMHLMHSAAPQAKMLSFDPKKRPDVAMENHRHFRSDWGKHIPILKGLCKDETGLVFFDDHQDQELRLFQASEVGIEHLIFHDNYLTPHRSHVPIRFVDLTFLADFCFEFPPLLARHDEVFKDNKRRWITYVRLK